MDLKSIIIKPIMSEKSLIMANHGQYSFYVQPNATKHQIKQAITTFFGSTPQSISTVTIRGIKKRVPGKRMYTVTPTKKKAVITLKKGDKIALFEQWFDVDDAQKSTSEDDKKAKTKKTNK